MKDAEFVISGKVIVIPNAIMTVILVGVTAGLFYLMNDPSTAAIASAGFAIVIMLAKALQINFGSILTVLSKDENDLPEGVQPMMSPTPGDAEVKRPSKIKAFLRG